MGRSQGGVKGAGEGWLMDVRGVRGVGSGVVKEWCCWAVDG